jgi:hypothetical protein
MNKYEKVRSPKDSLLFFNDNKNIRSINVVMKYSGVFEKQAFVEPIRFKMNEVPFSDSPEVEKSRREAHARLEELSMPEHENIDELKKRIKTHAPDLYEKLYANRGLEAVATAAGLATAPIAGLPSKFTNWLPLSSKLSLPLLQKLPIPTPLGGLASAISAGSRLWANNNDVISQQAAKKILALA